jgi:hypothetical protein
MIVKVAASVKSTQEWSRGGGRLKRQETRILVQRLDNQRLQDLQELVYDHVLAPIIPPVPSRPVAIPPSLGPILLLCQHQPS